MQGKLYALSPDDVQQLRQLAAWWRQHKNNILPDQFRRWWPVGGGGGGGDWKLAAVIAGPIEGDLYYKVKLVSGGVTTGEELHAFILTDAAHFGQPVLHFDHVFTLDEMLWIRAVNLVPGSPVWIIEGSRSYTGPSGSILFDPETRRIRAVFGGTE